MTPEQREELANRIAESGYVRGKYTRHYAEGIGKAGEVLSPVWELIAWRRFPWRALLLLIAMFMGLCLYLFLRKA
jgi:hypothetical protein